jgi:hypothetical protein
MGEEREGVLGVIYVTGIKVGIGTVLTNYLGR